MTGFGARNLKYMRAFAEAYPNRQFVQQAVAQLPWGYSIRILELVKSPKEREWYICQSVQSGWTRNVLVHQRRNPPNRAWANSRLTPDCSSSGAVSMEGATTLTIGAAAFGGNVSTYITEGKSGPA